MPVTEREKLRQDVLEVAAITNFNRASLIPVLRRVKEKYSGIDNYAIQVIANTLGIPPVEVYAVATFYSFLKPQTEGLTIFRLCRTLSCDLEGKAQVADSLRKELGIGFGETTCDGRFTLEWANCIGLCDQGPAMLVNGTVYTRLTPDKVRDIVAEYRGRLESEA